jgi:hypothetical protein
MPRRHPVRVSVHRVVRDAFPRGDEPRHHEDKQDEKGMMLAVSAAR